MASLHTVQTVSSLKSSNGSLALLVSAYLVLILSGCAMYNHPYPVETNTDRRYDLHVVQSDDYGSFWDTNVAQSALNHIDALSKKTNTLVVVFIHGWHHNAQGDDDNLGDFKESLGELYDELTKEARKELRRSVTRSDDFRIVGIYIGWRGRSLPWLADYATFWGRKSAAERIGGGDVSEFIERLQRIYLRANAHDENDVRGSYKPFTGLVTVGHSFGGQVLWQSLERLLEDSLIRRAPCMANLLDPAARPTAEEERLPIDSLGDLNLLVNPALEAYQYARVDALYRQLKYPPSQTPQVVVFSADNDDARKIWFPLARGASALFRPLRRSDNDGYQGTLYGHALGEVATQLTHILGKTQDPKEPDSLVEDDYKEPAKIVGFDFTGETVFAGVNLAPMQRPAPGQAGRVPYSPVLVVQFDGQDRRRPQRHFQG
jgi:hypothetical protein